MTWACLWLQAWLAQYQDGTACAVGGATRPFGRAGQLQQAFVLQFGGAGGGEQTASSSSDTHSGGGGGGHQETESAAARRAANAKILMAPLVGAAGQLPKLDLFFLFRKYLQQHGSGLQVDSKVFNRMCLSQSRLEVHGMEARWIVSDKPLSHACALLRLRSYFLI